MIDRIQTLLELTSAGNFEALFALVSAFVVLACCFSLFYQYRIYCWPSTEGVLDRKDLDKFGASNVHPTYGVGVSYRYTVNDQEYTGSRLSPMQVQGSGAGLIVLKKILDGVAGEGETVTVYYKPSNPAKSFLQKPGWVSLGMTLGMQAIFLAVFVTLFSRLT